MKKKLILVNTISILCIGVSAFMVTSFANNKTYAAVGAGDYYSLTINAEDVTTSTDLVFGSYVAHTDQLNNPVTFYYENIRFEQNDSEKYLVFGENAFFGNDKSSQIRKIETVTVFGNNSSFIYDYGWSTKAGSIVYTGGDYSGSANGNEINLGTNWPNFFTIMHSNGVDSKISKIIFKYKRDCTPGVMPTLESISLSGYTTSINRGKAFTYGGTVTANYANGTTANVTSLTTFSGYNMSLGGSYTVTASYTEEGITKTASYTLTVNKVWSPIWSGTRDIYVRHMGGSDATTSGMGTIVSGAVHYSKQLRVTYSATYLDGITQWPTDNSNYMCGIYWGNASRATSFGSSPKTVTLSSWGSNLLVVRTTPSDSANYASAYWNAFKIATDSNGNITASVLKTPTYGNTKVGIKLTKIEEYY